MLARAEEAKRQMDEPKPLPRYNLNPVVETRPSNSRKPPSRQVIEEAEARLEIERLEARRR